MRAEVKIFFPFPCSETRDKSQPIERRRDWRILGIIKKVKSNLKSTCLLIAAKIFSDKSAMRELPLLEIETVNLKAYVKATTEKNTYKIGFTVSESRPHHC